MIEGMKMPLLIRPLTEDERKQVQAGLRSSDAFVLRRGPLLLASDRSESASVIAKQRGCHKQTVLTVIHSFNATGLAVLAEGTSCPHRLRTTFSEEGLSRLQDLLPDSPRDWWSRFAQPQLQAWQSKEQPVRLVEQPWQKDDPDRHPCWPATASYGTNTPLRIPTGRRSGCASSRDAR
jgi:hypothetical protein